jgi:hypothetical protein
VANAMPVYPLIFWDCLSCFFVCMFVAIAACHKRATRECDSTSVMIALFGSILEPCFRKFVAVLFVCVCLSELCICENVSAHFTELIQHPSVHLSLGRRACVHQRLVLSAHVVLVECLRQWNDRCQPDTSLGSSFACLFVRLSLFKICQLEQVMNAC